MSTPSFRIFDQDQMREILMPLSRALTKARTELQPATFVSHSVSLRVSLDQCAVLVDDYIKNWIDLDPEK